MAIHKYLEVIIFDLDGTLVDLDIEWDIVKARTLRRADQTLGQRIEELIANKDHNTLAIITEYEEKALKSAVLNPEVAKMFQTLSLNYKIAILTRNSRYIAEKFLQMLGVNHTVQCIVGREDVSRLKPNPEGLRLILDYFKTSPDSAILIGDTFHDIELANNSGMKSILIGSKVNIKETTTTYQADNLSDVTDIIHNIDRGKA